MARILSSFSRGLPLWVILGAAAAYIWPQAFAWTGWPLRYLLGGFLRGEEPAPPAGLLDLPGQGVFQWMFAATMAAVGTVLDPRDFALLARRPRAAALGVLTQFTVMPLLGWMAARFCGFDAAVALGFILIGCVPGAMTSNVLTYLARGDAAYSVTLTTIATVLSVAATPALVLFLGGERLGVTAEHSWGQVWTIAWTVVLPLLLGLGLRAALPSGRRLFDAVSPALAVAAIVVVCCFVIQWTRDYLAEATPGIFAAVAAVNLLGYALGALAGRLFRLPRPQAITLAIEVGMQNAGMGVVIATTVFRDRPSAAIPAALFTIWCILTASILIAALKGAAAAARRTAAPARAVLLYDGRCTFCQAQSARLIALTPPGSVERLSFHDPGALERFPGIAREDCERAMQLILPDGRIYSGFEAAVRAAALRPWGRIAYLYYIPGLRLAADLLYRLIARYRSHL